MLKKIISCFLKTEFLVFFLAFFLRLGYWLFLKNNYFFYSHPADDVLYYQKWAQEIAYIDFWGTKTFFGLPLYAYFLAVLKRLSFNQEIVVRSLHLILGSFNCVLTYLLAKKLWKKEIAALAGFLMAIHFTLIHYDWIMLSVPLLVCLSLLIIYLLAQEKTLQSKREWFFLGILLGLNILGDGKMIIFFILLLMYLFWKKYKAQPLKPIFFLPLICAVLLVVSICTVRNRIAGGSWVWISAQSGLSFYVGNNPHASGIFENLNFIRPIHEGQDEDQVIMAQTFTGEKLSSAEVSQFWFKQGLSFIQNDPAGYLKLLWHKFFLFFVQTESAMDIDLILLKEIRQKLDINPFFLILPLALAGIFLSRRASTNTGLLNLLNLLILSQLIFTLLFFLYDRHRITILPVLILYEAYTISWIFEQWQKKNFLKIFWTCIGLTVFLFIFKPQTLNSATITFLKHTKAGPIYEGKKEFKKAQEEYFGALNVQPNDTNTLYNLANTFFLQGQLPEAKNYYQKTLALNPLHVDALFNLGMTYEKSEEDDLAIKAYRRLLALQPNAVDACFRLGQIFQKRKKCDKAKIQYDKIKMLKPELTQRIDQLFAGCSNREDNP